MHTDWPQGLFTVHDLARLDLDPRAVNRAIAAGTLIRIKRGAYCRRDAWVASTAESQHRLRVHATARSHPGSVFSHWSAAVLHGLPIIGPWPADAHVAAGRATGGRSEVGVRRQCRQLGPRDWTTVEGFAVTTIERTIVDLAVAQSFRFAVAPADFALRTKLTTPDQLANFLLEAEPFRGRARARRVVEFADGMSGSAGESLSRAGMHELGFPPPHLQVKHRTRGSTDFVDFEWDTPMRIGEFDGFGKYQREEYLNGRTSAEAVIEEKRREDRLRLATGKSFVRWGWTEAIHLTQLRDILLAAGLPIIAGRGR